MKKLLKYKSVQVILAIILPGGFVILAYMLVKKVLNVQN
jgi:hypothetical protein